MERLLGKNTTIIFVAQLSLFAILTAAWRLSTHLLEKSYYLSSPNLLRRLLGIHPIENAVTSQQDEIVRIIVDFNVVNFWVDYDDVGISVVFLHFRVAISECAANRESTWDDAHWTLGNRSSWARKHNVIILVNLSASFQDPLPFWFF